MHTELYYKAANGSIRFWRIYDEDFDIIIEYGVVGGEVIEESEHVPYGLGTRTREEQVASRMNSRINAKLDKGYVRSIEEAQNNKPLNALGFLKPMLANPIDKVKNVEMDNAFVQYKYDGHRCLVTNDGGKLVAYSRNGKEITTIPEILSGLVIPEGVTIDGELYIHGVPLQTISSYVKRRQEWTKSLKLQVYDVMLSETYDERYRFLHQEVKLGDKALLVPTWEFDPDTLRRELCEAINYGYEGLIVRADGFNYEDGKRSKGLLKVKQFHDDEFMVTAISEDANGGAILHCITHAGKTFKTPAPGDRSEKSRVLRNSSKYIGMKIQVKFANYTRDGIPFHPIATFWRDKESE